MNDKLIKILIIGIASIIILSGFNSSASKNVKSTLKDNLFSDSSELPLSPKKDKEPENFRIVKDEFLSDSIFFKDDDFNKIPIQKNEYVPGEIIVKFKTNTRGILSVSNHKKISIPSIDNLNEIHGVKAVEKVFKNNENPPADPSDFTNIYKFKIYNDEDIFPIIEEYNKDPNVLYAEPNYIYHTCIVPGDPYFDQQWALNQNNDHDIDAPEAWDIETGSSDMIIAIADSGVDYNHPDIAVNIWINSGEIPNNGVDDDGNGFVDDEHGWDFANDDNDPMDDVGHGTHCAGIAAAITNNDIGVAGVCWNTRIMSIKIGSFGISIDDAANGIIYAVDNGADVISMSWGGYALSNVLKDVIDYAYSRGCVLVAAVGNSRTDEKLYPSGYDNVIAVAATNQSDAKASFSNYGLWVDVAAPGVDILSLRANGTDLYGDGEHIVNEEYYLASGTSMACPIVAGVAGLLLSKNQSLTPDMIKTIVRASVDMVNLTGLIGKGRINAHEALLREPVIALLEHFLDWSNLKGIVEIRGTAWSEHLQYYNLEYAKGKFNYSNDWTVIVNSTVPVQNGVLASWNTSELNDDLYTIKLKVVCNDGVYEDITQIVVNNKYNVFIVDNETGPNVDYTSIQEAVENAGCNDEIHVQNGTYNEDIKIDRTIKLIANYTNETIIQKTVEIVADSVQVRGFTLNHWNSGFIIYNVENIVITRNHIEKCDFGIRLYYSNNNVFDHNVIERNIVGIYSYSSNNNTIAKNNLSISHYGLDLRVSKNNIIYNNTFVNMSDKQGIYLAYGGGNLLRNNSLQDCGLFIHGDNISHYFNDVDESNTVNGKPIYYCVNETGLSPPCDVSQVIVVNCNNFVLSNITFKYSIAGIKIAYCNNFTVSNISVNDCLYGIYIVSSNDNNEIVDNHLNSCRVGLILESSSNNTISRNIANDNIYGIGLQQCNNNIYNNYLNNNSCGIKLVFSNYSHLNNNIIFNSTIGIELLLSRGNILRNNKMMNCGLRVKTGDNYMYKIKIEDFWNDIDTSNTVNDKPVYYYLNQTDISVPDDAGQVILVNCSNFKMSNLSINGTVIPIELAFSSNNTIKDNVLKNIVLYSSDKNNIKCNILNDCSLYSIRLYDSNYNNISDNVINNSSSSPLDNFWGIHLIVNSCNNNIYGNRIFNIKGYIGEFWIIPGLGITLDDSNNNTINRNTIEGGLHITGIKSFDGFNNTICRNIMSENKGRIWDGILDIYGSNFKVIGNTILNNNDSGINAEGKDHIISGNNIVGNAKRGISVDCPNNVVDNNTIERNGGDGIRVFSHHNNICDNTIIENDESGIWIRGRSNSIRGNLIKNNSYGVRIDGYLDLLYGDNLIYHNYFIDNDLNAFDIFENSWDNDAKGNYWDDYDGVDANDDGIGDTPYDIPGPSDSQDSYPLGYFRETNPPIVKIEKPEKALYIMNFKIRRYLIRKPLIIGKITIEVNATDNESDIDRVEFYIDDELRANDMSAPYSYNWARDKITLLRHRHNIKVVVYDKAGNSAAEEIRVWKFF